MNIIAVDFDGTLCDHEYPGIGKPNVKLIELVKDLRAKGAQLVLWTCREGIQLEDAIVWCREFGLEFDAVNENAPGVKEKIGVMLATRKIYADIYIDDRGIHPDRILEGVL